MATLSYIIAYLCTGIFWAIVVFKCVSYLKKPLHARWELYPVAHEDSSRVAYGGSYLEDSGWWQKSRKKSPLGGIKAVVVEFSLLRSTFHNNRALWWRTYPFHLGLYLLALTMCLATAIAISSLFGVGDGAFMPLLTRLGQCLSLAAFLCLSFGAVGLIHRRLTVPDLKNFSTPEHFFNLGLFIGLGVQGLFLWVTMPSLFENLYLFMGSLLAFSFAPQGGLFFNVFIIYVFLLLAYIPTAHMGHFFMKYFLWHDIRWDDQPTQENPAIQREINEALERPISWKGGHVGGKGEQSWGAIASSKPVKPKESV